MNKMHRFLDAATVSDYQNFRLAGNAHYLNYVVQLPDVECIQQVLDNLARSRGKTNDLCIAKPLIFSED